MATVTAFTAERSQEIEDTTVVSGLVDVNGHLILYTRAGSPIDAGNVQGPAAVYPGALARPNTGTTYVRVATLDGINAASGAQLVLEFSGGGNVGLSAKYSARVHIGQRGAGIIDLDVWEWGELSGSIQWGYVPITSYQFEVWVRVPSFPGPVTVVPRAAWNAVGRYDLEQTTMPVGWVQTNVTVERPSQQAASAALKDPVGSITAYAGVNIPAGWLNCNGQAVSRTTFSDLFTILGTRYGAGDGTTTFTLPNLKGRTIVGVDTGQTEFDALGETGGEKTHQLTAAEMAHQHAETAAFTSAFVTGNGFMYTNGGSVPSAPPLTGGVSAGTVTAHNNLQPYITLNYIIKT